MALAVRVSSDASCGHSCFGLSGDRHECCRTGGNICVAEHSTDNRNSRTACRSSTHAASPRARLDVQTNAARKCRHVICFSAQHLLWHVDEKYHDSAECGVYRRERDYSEYCEYGALYTYRALFRRTG